MVLLFTVVTCPGVASASPVSGRTASRTQLASPSDMSQRQQQQQQQQQQDTQLGSLAAPVELFKLQAVQLDVELSCNRCAVARCCEMLRSEESLS